MARARNPCHNVQPINHEAIMYIFNGSGSSPWAGAALVTPSCTQGLTLWIGKLVICMAWRRSELCTNHRGVDASWGDVELFRFDIQD